MVWRGSILEYCAVYPFPHRKTPLFYVDFFFKFWHEYFIVLCVLTRLRWCKTLISTRILWWWWWCMWHSTSLEKSTSCKGFYNNDVWFRYVFLSCLCVMVFFILFRKTTPLPSRTTTTTKKVKYGKKFERIKKWQNKMITNAMNVATYQSNFERHQQHTVPNGVALCKWSIVVMLWPGTQNHLSQTIDFRLGRQQFVSVHNNLWHRLVMSHRQHLRH